MHRLSNTDRERLDHVHRRPARTSTDRGGIAYKWIALSNTTLGMLMVTINSSILLIALPDIFRGIRLDPLAPGNTSYFLWILTGFLLVTSVLVVSLGRIGDIYGRVKMFNLGFAIFTAFSILLAVTWMTGTHGALWIVVMRLGQGVGGAFLFANSSAILTDAFPENERGMALGINGVAAIGGSFLGLILGGLLAPIEWHLVFVLSVPLGLFGTVWSYLKLKDNGVRTPSHIDWAGQRVVRARAGRRAHRDRLRPAALRRPHDGLDQAVRPDLPVRRPRRSRRCSPSSRRGSRIRCSDCTCSRTAPSPWAT